MKSLEKSQFFDIMGGQAESGLLNTLAIQTRIHNYRNLNFIIEHFVYEDRKIILDCYQVKKKEDKSKEELEWDLVIIQIDVEINGHFVV